MQVNSTLSHVTNKGLVLYSVHLGCALSPAVHRIRSRQPRHVVHLPAAVPAITELENKNLVKCANGEEILTVQCAPGYPRLVAQGIL